MYAQYGCGLSAPEGWINFDASPTLRLQKTPLLGELLKSSLNAVFPDAVKYGDIVKGLPLSDNSCDAVYCSHVLEHLALKDFRLALANTHKILKSGGIFRCVVPDLEVIARRYISDLENGSATASIDFIGNGTLLGVLERPRGIKALAASFLGNAHHLWMWDHSSLTQELQNAGFINVRRALFNDSKDEKFKLVEDKDRFDSAVALECFKK
mgnify:CR=1 FL=1